MCIDLLLLTKYQWHYKTLFVFNQQNVFKPSMAKKQLYKKKATDCLKPYIKYVMQLEILIIDAQ